MFNDAMKTPRVLAGAAVGLILSLGVSGASAEPRELNVDLSHTSVHFTIGHGGFTKVVGQFRKIDSVTVIFDPDDVSKSSVKASIEAASLDSNHFYRDNYVRSAAFLDARKFKDITFESTEITKTGEKTGKMTGNLTMHGVTKPVTLDVVWNNSGKHLSGKYMIDGFTATGTLSRTEFGIAAFKPWVSDEVGISIQVEGHFGN